MELKINWKWIIQISLQYSFKVIEDVKATQSDINLLEGKLYRTYVEADSRIFEFAKGDQQMIPGYKVIIKDN